MSLTGEEWHRLANGWYGSAVRAFAVDPVLSVRLGVSTVSVSIHYGYIQKIRFKHNIAPAIFEYIPHIAATGDVYLDGRAANHLQIYGDIFGQHFKLVLKGATEKNEIWIVTFHRVNETERLRIASKKVRIK